MASSEAITVGMRLRPLIPCEKGQLHCINMKDNVVSLIADVAGIDTKSNSPPGSMPSCTPMTYYYNFDYAMDSSDPTSPDFVSQETCYELMGRRLLEHMLDGFSTCLFCYGQTGTGKTTTIMGLLEPVTEQGILMRLLSELFVEVEKMRSGGTHIQLKVQMVEIYNEKVNDLINPTCKSRDRELSKVDVHVHPQLGVYLKGATDQLVQSFTECIEVLEFGNNNHSVHATAMNAQSSRGHTVFKLRMEKKETDGTMMSSEVYFADLAGRENEKTTLVTGDRLVELSFINRSLMWLSDCIRGLGDGSSGPRGRAMSLSENARKKLRADMTKFRNSKLTLLLANALSGNSRTTMIGTLSPAKAHVAESLSTLKFASTVKSIETTAKPATTVDETMRLKSLEEEVLQLRDMVRDYQSGRGPSVSTDQIADLTSQLIAAEGISETHYKNRNSCEWEDVMHEAAEQARARGEGLLESNMRKILGATRASDPSRIKEAEQYFEMLKSHNSNPQLIRAFLNSLQLAKTMVDQANAITDDVKPKSGLTFELMAMTPVFAFGFSDDVGTKGHLPDVSVRLMRNLTVPKTRWRWAVQKIQAKNNASAAHGSQKIATRGLISQNEFALARMELVCTWSWKKFDARLDMMQDIHAKWAKHPDNFQVDPMRDPWTPWGPGETPAALQEHINECATQNACIRRLSLNVGNGQLAREVLESFVLRRRQSEPTSMLSKQLAASRKCEQQLAAENKQLAAMNQVLQCECEALQERVLLGLGENHSELIGQLMQARKREQQLAEDNKALQQELQVMQKMMSASNKCLEQSKTNLLLLETLNTRFAEQGVERASLKSQHAPP